MSEFHQKNCADWIAIQNQVFGTSIPTTQEWTQLDDIIQILSPFCGAGRNHMFLPAGGGLDLDAVIRSHEAGCLELLTGSVPNIVSPARLIFESFPDCLSLSYFRLETNQLAPAVAHDHAPSGYEEVVELSCSPEHYIKRMAWDDGHYGHDENGREIPLPKSARLAIRWFSGSFVVFAKGSLYNQEGSTYDARHNKMSAIEFRAYVSRIVAKVTQ